MYTMFLYSHNKILNETLFVLFLWEGEEFKYIAGNYYAWVKESHVSSYTLTTIGELFPLWTLGQMNK